ncbi:MAG: FAD:protein FMN transferase [Candidatus Margulisbacteria bacterium]|nr:FAD:protein FMN transferase [Candidatus Margulisiibacteriota bacterium]
MKKNIVIICLTLILLFLLALYLRTITNPELQKKTQILMDTYCTITVPGGPESIAAIDKAFARMREVDQKFSIGNSLNAISAFNERNIPIDDAEIANVVRVAIKYSEIMDGAFDITIEPLVRLWGFYGEEAQHVPDIREIQKRLPLVNYHFLKVGGNIVIKTIPGVGVDFGGIAKGYAVQQAVKVLREQGIKSALIDAGGQIYTLGLYQGKEWKIGVKHPRNEGVMSGLKISDMSAATSGDYQRFFIEKGVRYCHLINPRTGFPGSDIIGITVIHPDPMIADVLSKSFILGKDKALKLINSIPEADCILMTNTNEIYYSDKIKKRLLKLNTITH